MGKKLSELNQQNSATQEEYLLIDKDNAQESHKIKLKDIDVVNFLNGELVNEVKYAMEELGGASLYDGIQKLFKNVPHTHFTNRITSDNTTQAPTVKAVYDYILENGGGSGIKEKVDNPKLWELTSGMYEVTSGFYYTVDNYQSLENTSAILFIGDDSPEQDINYFMIAGRVKYYGVMKIDGSDGTIVTEDFSNEEISKTSTNKDIPSSKAVYDFVTSETEAKVSTNPNIWELDKGWHYINQGFYVSKDEYIKIHSAVIYKTQGANLTCTYMGFGSVDYKQSNTIWGQIIVGGSGVTGYCIIEKFTEKIDAVTPSEHTYPSEKAIVDYIGNLKHIETLTEDTDIDGNFPSGVYLTNGHLVKFLDSEGHMLFNNSYFPVLLIHYKLSDGRYFGLYHECSPTGDEFYGGYISMYNSEYGKKVLADEDFVRDQIKSLIDSAPEALDTLKELADALNNDENFASTVMEQIGKKIDKEAITTEVSGNSTDDEIASAKAVYDFVVNNKEIEVVSNPKIWELKSGLYRVQGGFYHSNEKEINDLINGEISATMPNQSTADYEAIDHEMFLIVYKKLSDVENTICRFTVFGDDTDSYSGIITTSLLSFEDNMYEIYSGNLVSITKTNEVNENSTNEQYPSAKAVYDLVQNEKLAIVTNPNLYELNQGWYIVQTGFYYNNDNSQYQKITDILTMLVEQGDYETRFCYGYVRGALKYVVVMTPNSTSNAVFEYTARGEIITSDSTHYETPTTKAVYDFVTSEVEIKALTEPKIWELEKGLHYITKGLYVNEGKYVRIPNGALIFKSGEKNTTCNYFGLGIGITGNNSINTIYGDCMLVDGVWVGNINVNDFVDEINGEYPYNFNVPTEKAVVDFVQKQLNSLIDTAPDKLNTLNELANALNNDENFASTVMEQIGKKIDKEAITTEVSGNSTDDEIATTKAVYDFIKNGTYTREYITTDISMLDLETNLYEINTSNSVVLTLNDDKSLELGEGLIINNSYELDGNKANYGLILGNTTSGEPVYMYYCVSTYVAEIVNILKDYATDKEVDAKISSLENTVYKKQILETDISLLDLDTGIYYADASVAPTTINITSDRQMSLNFGKIINYKLSTQMGDTSIRMCNGLIFGFYTSEKDDDRQSIIYYSIMEQNGEVNVLQFTDLIEDFLTEEDFRNKLQTTISSSSTDNEIPTAKAVFDYFSTNAHKRQYINSSTYLYSLGTGIYEVSATEVLNKDYSNILTSTTFKPIDIHITDYKIVEMVSGMILHHRGKVEAGVNYDDVYSGLIIGKFGNTIGDTDKEINKVYYYSGYYQRGTPYLLSFIDLTGDSFINKDQITQIINADSTHSQIPTAEAVYEKLEQKSQVQIIIWEEND
jgi:hypothetical protein